MWFLRGLVMFYALCSFSNEGTDAVEVEKEEIDKVIEDEITQKLSVDLIQSIEMKFHVDLEKSVNMVLMKIKMLLQNGTLHIQDRMTELETMLDAIKQHDEKEVERCLLDKQNDTSALAEKALHQMVICGYALIGHDPAQAVKNVIGLKEMIKQGIQPINEQRGEVYGLLKVCGHDHETLKKVIKCVISKSPLIKTTMMEVTGKLIEGIIDLTKLLAQGAMHEACLIEVIRSVEEEAFILLERVKSCTYGNETIDVAASYIRQNNATVLDIVRNDSKINISSLKTKHEGVKEMTDLIRRMLAGSKGQELDRRFKKKLVKLQTDLGAFDANDIDKNIIKFD